MSAFEQLPLRQRLFLLAWMDPESPTFGNQTRSYMAAYQNGNHSSSAANAHKLLNKPQTEPAITELLEDLGLGRPVRLRYLAEIASGKHERIVRTVDPSGEETVSSSTPTASEAVKAIQLVMKAAGDFEPAKLASIGAREGLRALYRKQSRIFGEADEKRALRRVSSGDPVPQPDRTKRSLRSLATESHDS